MESGRVKVGLCCQLELSFVYCFINVFKKYALITRQIKMCFFCGTFQIISDLLHFKGSHKHEFDSRWKSFNLVKKSMENRVSLWFYFVSLSGDILIVLKNTLLQLFAQNASVANFTYCLLISSR